MKTIQLNEKFFEGVVSFNHGDGWIQPLRLRNAEIPLYDPNFVLRASKTSGCRLRFITDAASLVLEVEPDAAEGERLFDLTTDETLWATVRLPPGMDSVKFDNLPGDGRVIELWLPMQHEVRLRALRIDDAATLRPASDRRPRWVTYGSSITHCATAHSPSQIWPAVAARACGLNLTSLGYGGQCHMDPLVALMIRDLPADFISLKVGINMVGGSVSQRTYRALLVGMVRIIREKHPETPIAVVSPIISPPREETPGATGMTLQRMRAELEDAVDALRACGDRHVHYVNGLDLFGADLVQPYLPDLLHPNGDGYLQLGRNFADVVIDKLWSLRA